MNVYFNRIGLTDPESKIFRFQEPPEKAKEFIRHLLRYTVDNRHTRLYSFRSESSMACLVTDYAKALLDPLSMDPVPDLDQLTMKVAEGLLNSEEQANARLISLGRKIKTGSLVLSLARDEDKTLCFIIAKVDHSRFFEGADLNEYTGFSRDHEDIWKTAVVRFKEEPEIAVENVLVYMDRPAKYWTEGFLQLDEVRTDEMNSRCMYQCVREVIRKRLESVSANDCLLLCSSLAHRIRTETEINYEQFVDELLDNYEPQDAGLGESFWVGLKEKILALPDERGFDRQFKVATGNFISMIKKQTVEITDGIELTVREEVRNPAEWISTCVDRDGTKYIKVRCTKDVTLFESK